jgi:hypothetical protein
MIQLDSLQLCVFAFALASTWEEQAFTFPFREVVFDIETKFRKLKTAHRAGAVGVLSILCFPIVNLMTVEFSWPVFWEAVLTTTDLGLLYFLVFDIGYALHIGQRWYYLGGTAGTDMMLKRWFGKYAGQIKAAISFLCIIAINLVIHKLL